MKIKVELPPSVHSLMVFRVRISNILGVYRFVKKGRRVQIDEDSVRKVVVSPDNKIWENDKPIGHLVQFEAPWTGGTLCSLTVFGRDFVILGTRISDWMGRASFEIMSKEHLIGRIALTGLSEVEIECEKDSSPVELIVLIIGIFQIWDLVMRFRV